MLKHQAGFLVDQENLFNPVYDAVQMYHFREEGFRDLSASSLDLMPCIESFVERLIEGLHHCSERALRDSFSDGRPRLPEKSVSKSLQIPFYRESNRFLHALV